MKKKMAYFLATVMTITALPINVFAQPMAGDLVRNLSPGSGRTALARLGRSPIVAPERTVFTEWSSAGNNNGISGEITGSNVVDHWMEGNELNIIFEEDIPNISTGVQFVVELDNAQWFFRNASAGDIGSLGRSTYSTANGTWDTATNTYTRTGGPEGTLKYTLEVSRANPRRATVSVIDGRGIEDFEPYNVTSRRNINITDNGSGGASTQPATPNNGSGGASTQPATPGEHPGESTGDIQVPSTRGEDAVEATAVAKKKKEQPSAQEEQKEQKAPTVKLKATEKATERSKTSEEATKQGTQPQAPESTQKELPKPKASKQESKRSSEDVVMVDAMDPVDDYNREMGISRFLIRDENGDYAYRTDAMEAIDAALGALGEANIENASEVTDEAIVLGALNRAEVYITNAIDYLEPDSDATYTTILTDLNAALTAVESAIYEVDDDPDPVYRFDSVTVGAYIATAEGRLRDAETALRAIIDNNEDTDDGEFGIASGDRIVIPLVTRSVGANNDMTVRVVEATPIPIQQHTLVFARGTAPGRTNTSIQSPSTGRDRINVGAIGVFENRTGIFPTSGSFELVAPAGYTFANPNNTDPRAVLTAEGGLSLSTSPNNTIEIVPNSDARVIRVNYYGLRQSTSITGNLVLRNLVLISTNPDVVREGDVEITIRNTHGNDIVTEQSFTAATISDWRVRLQTTGTIPELVNGRLVSIEDRDVRDPEHRAARVRVEEAIADAWWGQRSTTFTLPQGVRVRKAGFRNIRNLTSGSINDLRPNGWFYNDRGRDNRPEHMGNTPSVRVNDNVITVSGLEPVRGERVSFDLDLWLNVESGFTGDIDLTLGGSAITSTDENPTVTVATAINPITIDANLSNVRMGYNFVPVGDFRIKENVAGALRLNEELFVSVTDEFFSELHIGANFAARVSEGDLLIRNVRASNNLGFMNNTINWRTGTNAILEIDRESTRPSTIEFTNVSLRLSPVVPIPQTQNRYDIVAWGPAVAANFEGIRDIDNDYVNRNEFFNTPGIIQPFINVAGSGSSLALTNIVRVTANSPILMVNNEQMTMDTAAYISPVSESLMVPVRFISMALGLEAGRVMWSPETSTVTVDAGERIVQFRTNSSVMLINGIEIPMLNALGNPVFSEVRDERAFIPFRPLAEALNVYVEWNPTTATATFDPTRAATRTFHLEDVMGQAFYGDLHDDVITGNNLTAGNVAFTQNTYNMLPRVNSNVVGQTAVRTSRMVGPARNVS